MRKRLSVLKFANGVFSKLSFERLKTFFSDIFLLGVANEKDESKQKFIIQLNLISIATFVINGITGLLFFFIVDHSPGISFILSSFMWLLPIYINRNGLKLISRTLLVFLTLMALLIASCWYTHNTMLDSYFLIVAINSNFMYSTTHERKWALGSTFLALLLFITESTSLQNYLPDYNTLKITVAVNYILLFGAIMTIVVDLAIYAYINRLRETNLITKQKELEDTQRRVQIQNDDLKTFSIAASHSMQTPLHVSSFFLEKIKTEIAPVATEDSKKSIELIQNGLNQMELLVSGLFSYNKIINIENERNQFDVFKEIELVKKGIGPRYPGSKIFIAPINQVITANQLLFSIIIYNLIDNSLKYNRSDIPEVRIEMQKNAGKIILFIKDNGIGIPEKYFTAIFEPFKRIQTSNHIKPGNGLGLAGAKRAAERIRGNLLCDKSDEYGTTFKLEIPIE